MKKRNVLLMAAIAVVVVIIAMTAYYSKREERERFYSREHGFSIVFPKHWDIEQKETNTAVIALSIQEGSKDFFRENVNIAVEEVTQNISLEEYVKMTKENMQIYTQDYKLLNEEHITLSGKPAFAVRFSYSMGGLPLIAIQYYVVHNNNVYVITGTALPEAFKRYVERFDAVAKSFQFE